MVFVTIKRAEVKLSSNNLTLLMWFLVTTASLVLRPVLAKPDQVR
jgi:hypothetical protein